MPSPQEPNEATATEARAQASCPITAENAQNFRAVADYTNDWESWHAPDGRLLWVNPAVARITGYSVEECLSMADYPLQMVAAEDRAAVAEALASARAQKSGESMDFRSLSRTGESRWVSLSWQPMYDHERRHLGFRTSSRDVTERQELREQLRLHTEHLEQLVQERTIRLRRLELRQRQMEKLAALGELAAGIAHEINNPLAGMRNAFELIKSSLTPDHEHYDLLELIDKEIERISGITHQMHQLYRRTPQQPTDFELTHCVNDVIRLLNSSAAKCGVRLHCDEQNNLIQVFLVEAEVKQVIYNVVKNAIQASSPGQEVRLEVREDGGDVVLQVKDEGQGIPEDDLQRIFDPFFSTKQTDPQSGMGLGLALSRSLVESMGGRIDVSSWPGQGSVFSVVLPRRAVSSQGTGR